ncbi:3-hydroxybenzoate 6-monooxygenase [Microbacteriaceae bacterium K1510]|nr:3-hydroxybenzoate 6-monooxygenase [Microbacteriaceae bacterium K1510]
MALQSKRSVIVVGGGIGGLAAALALAKKGIAVQVFEQAPEFAEIGAGIQLGPNVFRMFECLGITDEVNKLAVFPESLMMRDSVTGEEVTSIRLDGAFRQRFQYPYAVIHRADLHRVLLAENQKEKLVSLTPGTKIVAVDQMGGGVTVRTEAGEEYAADALVGADGLWSSLRSLIVDDGKPVVSGHIAYRAVLPTSEMPEHLRWQSMVLWAGEKTHLVHYPLRGGELFNLVAVFHSDRYEEGWDSFGDTEELHKRFAPTCSEVRTLLAKIEQWRMWVLCDRHPVKQWTKGRITLLGDAAHPMLQYLAQGACMAIEDSICLADCVAEAGNDFEPAFQAYQEARYLRTGRVQITARVYGGFFHASGVARELRNGFLSQRTPEASLQSMDWLYGEQPGLGRTFINR